MNSLPVLMPGRLYLASGVGSAKENKNARDHASAGIGLADLTLVAGTSVLPAGIQLIDRDAFRAAVTPGQVVFAIHGICEANEPGRRVNSTLSVAIPADGQGTGYVAELYEWPGIEDAEAVRRTEQMAIQLYAERQGAGPFDPRFLWESGRTRYRLAGREVDIHTIQAAGVVNADGDWCCALAAAVLL
jgi:arginine decarboxylase